MGYRRWDRPCNCHAIGVVYQVLPALYTTASSIPSSAPATPNPDDPWDCGWFVDEGSVVVRVGAGPEYSSSRIMGYLRWDDLVTAMAAA